MSFLSVGKKLSPAGKAWKGFVSSLQTNLCKLSHSKTIKHAKKRLNTILRRSTKSLSHLRRKKLRGRSGWSTVPGTQRHPLFHRSFKPVYVDQIFASTVAVSDQVMEPSAAKGGRGGGQEEQKKQGVSALGSSSMPPMLWEVDERGEKFISDFRKEMSLQRERSLDEYQEMLARSA